MTQLLEQDGWDERGEHACHGVTDQRGELLQERAGALDRTGQRLGRLLEELQLLGQNLDRLDQTLFVPGLDDEVKQGLLTELELSVDAYNGVRDAAQLTYRTLILQREACGFRSHEVVRRSYAIPQQRLPPEEIALMGAFD